jgi:DNA-binding Lrp family transcriptional regulator
VTVELDWLDREIIQHLSEGIHSHQDLANECHVSRNTIYRRIIHLEKENILTQNMQWSINYLKLGISRINIAMNVNQENLPELLEALKAYPRTKQLYKAYGTHNIVLVAYCDYSKEGQTINEIKALSEKFNVQRMDISICFSYEKIDLKPFSDTIGDLQSRQRMLPLPQSPERR